VSQKCKHTLDGVGKASAVGVETCYGDRIPVGARFSAPVQTLPGAHPASCVMGTGPLSRD